MLPYEEAAPNTFQALSPPRIINRQHLFTLSLMSVSTMKVSSFGTLFFPLAFLFRFPCASPLPQTSLSSDPEVYKDACKRIYLVVLFNEILTCRITAIKLLHDEPASSIQTAYFSPNKTRHLDAKLRPSNRHMPNLFR